MRLLKLWVMSAINSNNPSYFHRHDFYIPWKKQWFLLRWNIFQSDINRPLKHYLFAPIKPLSKYNDKYFYHLATIFWRIQTVYFPLEDKHSFILIRGISARQSLWATSAAHDRQWSLRNTLDVKVIEGMPWFARSVYLLTEFFLSLHKMSTNLYQVMLPTWEKLCENYWNYAEEL